MLNAQRKSLNGSRVLLLGLAYKRNTSDWRESPSVDVAERLAESGAEVVFCDPHIPEVNALDLRFPLVEFGPAELAAADITIVLVDHDEFVPADDRRPRQPRVRHEEPDARRRIHRRGPVNNLPQGHTQR